MTPARLRALADMMERQHPDDVVPEARAVIAALEQWCEDNGYITPGRL